MDRGRGWHGLVFGVSARIPLDLDLCGGLQLGGLDLDLRTVPSVVNRCMGSSWRRCADI